MQLDACDDLLDGFAFEPGDKFEGMDGDEWIVTERLWNFDASEYVYENNPMRPGDEKIDVTDDGHRREYEISKPKTLGFERQRLNERDLLSHFREVADGSKDGGSR